MSDIMLSAMKYPSQQKVHRKCIFFSNISLFYASPAGKGLTSWLSFVMSNCEVVTFPLVSWVRCGA